MSEFRLLVSGSRYWPSLEHIERELSEMYHAVLGPETVLINGGAQGVDSMAARAWEGFGGTVETYHADWEQYGKRAGYLRNEQMVTEGHPTHFIAFQYNSSKGTQHQIDICDKYQIPARIFRRYGQ